MLLFSLFFFFLQYIFALFLENRKVAAPCIQQLFLQILLHHSICGRGNQYFFQQVIHDFKTIANIYVREYSISSNRNDFQSITYFIIVLVVCYV